MGPETVIDALVQELERALKALRAAQRMATELQRRPVGRPPRGQRPRLRSDEDLRYSGLTAAEAAVALEVSEEYVRRLLRRGALEGVPFGGRTGWRLSRDYVASVKAQLDSSKEGKEAARRKLIQKSRDEASQAAPRTTRKRST